MSNIVIIHSDNLVDLESLQAKSVHLGETYFRPISQGFFQAATFADFLNIIREGLSQKFTREDLDTWPDEALIKAYTEDGQRFIGGIFIDTNMGSDVPDWIIEQAAFIAAITGTAPDFVVEVTKDNLPPAPPPHVNREMRQITRHLVSGESTGVTVYVADEPGSGNANHLYLMDGFNIQTNPSIESLQDLRFDSNVQGIFFQNGPVPTAGLNGVTNELLLALVIDRLEGFQSGPFACDENATALEHTVKALETLQLRTKRRIAQNVEGVEITHSSEIAESIGETEPVGEAPKAE
jgi:hypothetical protein